jgi:uncharacterized membrane protein YraQ (UPF0718 family)
MKPKSRYFYIAIGLLLWIFLYLQIERVADYFTYSILGFERGLHFSEAIRFFIYEVPKVLLLLTLIVFVVGIIRSYFSPERTRQILGDKKLYCNSVLLLFSDSPFSWICRKRRSARCDFFFLNRRSDDQ